MIAGRLAVFALAALVVTGCSSTTESAVPTEPTTTTTTVAEVTSSDSAPGFAALNATEGYGFLRLMTLEERPGPLDIVIYEALPNELPRVAGIITGVAQTPLSHVNLRAVQDDLPNAFVADPLGVADIESNIGRYVHYVVTDEGYSIESATLEQVEAHHADARPSSDQTPERDLTVTEVTALSNLGFESWSAFGVKAANLSTLGNLELVDVVVPSGFAVPFAYYDDFMEVNGFYDEIKERLADPALGDDQDALAEWLAELRTAIKDAPMTPEAMNSLGDVQSTFAEGQGIRCRSSTNNEDLPNFSGAGLYDSFTQHPEEGHLSKCIKQVFASTWNFRAFLERDFHRIDHLTTAMGVLLHPNFEEEKANGVAVSIDPIYDTTDAYYVNTQLGEDLVTNPEALSIPEALFLELSGGIAVINRSNLVEPGELLMSEDRYNVLRDNLMVIHDEFAKLYGVEESEPFAMEIEFKVTVDGELSIKQARPWVFN